MHEVTVLIPTYKPDRKLAELLRRLSEQTIVPRRVLLLNTLDDSGGESISKIVDTFEGVFPLLSVFHVEKKDFDHGGTRHLGFSFCDTELVLCMTQDALPRDRHLIGNLAAAFDDASVAAAYGRQMAGKRSTERERFTRQFNYPETSLVKSEKDMERLGIKTFFCSDVCAMWRRDVYMELGGFERKTIFNEDMILAGKMIRAGYKIAYVADAAVWHSHSYSPLRQLKRNFDLGVSQAMHPEVFGASSSEGEGVKLVVQCARHLLASGHAGEIPALAADSGFKYAGYLLGKHYSILPGWAVLRLTDNRSFWDSAKR